MSIYLFMGTHLPEIAECFAALARIDALKQPTRIHVPDGLQAPFPVPQNCTVSIYPTESADWGLLQETEVRNFVLLDPRTSPVPQLEALAASLKPRMIEPDKVVTCVDCAAAESNPPLRTYIEACIYHSDNVLLGNRASASKVFVRNFEKEFERKCYPCLFLLLKGQGIPSDPVEVLTPGTRRISQVFDLTDNQEDTTFPALIEASCDLDLDEFEENPFLAEDEHSAPRIPIPDATPWIVPIQG